MIWRLFYEVPLPLSVEGNLKWNHDMYSTLGDDLLIKTRKLSYRKDNRAMHLWVTWKFSLESLSTPAATFLEICNGLLFKIWS